MTTLEKIRALVAAMRRQLGETDHRHLVVGIHPDDFADAWREARPARARDSPPEPVGRYLMVGVKVVPEIAAPRL
jgi:hypothetical protein